MKVAWFVLMIILFHSCLERNGRPDLSNTIFKLGFKSDESSTGPLDNSGFLFLLNDTTPPVLLTAHHVVAGNGDGKYFRWDEIGDKQINLWAWSMHDSAVNFKLSANVPIQNAETLKFDIAAFFVNGEPRNYLRPSSSDSEVGDTVYLFSKIEYQKKVSFVNPAVVVYVSDSVLVYELSAFHMARVMSGTSGSAVINKNFEVVSNSYAGFTIANAEVRKEIAMRFPLVNKFRTKDGKSYGIGIPVSLIKRSLENAFMQKR
jgi:hypothetical protein